MIRNTLLLAQYASESRVCKHLFLKGNHGMDMFHDKVDKINVWNRFWLSAYSTGTEVLSLKILNNHLHGTVRIQQDGQDSKFMHAFRLSITQYYNRRYNLKGMLGMRTFGRSVLKGLDDIKDCICYHIRNVLHHRISSNYMDYPFSTVRHVFGLATEAQKGIYTKETLPDNIAKAYLPSKVSLPDGWQMTQEGMIVPPKGVFRGDIVEALFGSKDEYLETLTHKTRREDNDQDEPETHLQEISQSLDDRVIMFLKDKYSTPIPSMTQDQKFAAMITLQKEMPKIGYRTLERIFGIPASTIRYGLKKLHTRE